MWETTVLATVGDRGQHVAIAARAGVDEGSPAGGAVRRLERDLDTHPGTARHTSAGDHIATSKLTVIAATRTHLNRCPVAQGLGVDLGFLALTAS
jgi:hypothetical protein